MADHARQLVDTMRTSIGKTLQRLGVEVLEGRGRLNGPHGVVVRSPQGIEREITAAHVIVATGSEPFVPRGADIRKLASKVTPGAPVRIELRHAASRELVDTLEVDGVLVATGRAPVSQELNLASVSESGLREHGDLERVATAGAQAVLVGEALMGEPDVAAALRTLRGGPPRPSALLQQQQAVPQG